MPTIDIQDKICPHCGGIKWKIEHRKKPTKADSDKKLIRYRCAKKGHERTERWRDKNPEKVKEMEHRKTKKLSEMGFYKTPEMMEYYRKKSNRESDTLANNFIYRMILNSSNMDGIKRSDIPQWLIEIKREQLLLTRQLRNNGKNN